ncbi:hypothetical protein L484_001618 [Morus notabilis]|uniref:Uncharacterized protein n=1 Tax=Morus notabilis TaxID=981085 RepID=W9RI84_9ROSA|nr:hypothetical protein L484_001618 [Morus notabilis]
MGTISTPKLVAVPVAVLEREESFDLPADGHHFDTKTCRRSRGEREESFDLPADGHHFDTKTCRRSRGGSRARRELRSTR